MRWFYQAMGMGAWPVMWFHVSWCTKAMRVSLLRQNNGRSNTTWFSWRIWWWSEVWNNGCFVRLGRCGIVIWRLITTTRAVWLGCAPYCSALLFGAWHVDPIAICPTCRREEVQNSWMRASTEDYKTRLGFFCYARSIDTNPDEKAGRVFSRAAGRGVWHSLFEATRQEGKQANKGWEI